MADFDFDLIGSFTSGVEVSPSPVSDEPSDFRVERRLNDDRNVEYSESVVPRPLSGEFNTAWDLHIRLCEVMAYQHDFDIEIAKHEAEIKALQDSVAAQILQQKTYINNLRSLQYDYRIEGRRLHQQYYSAMRQLRLAIDQFTQQQAYLDAGELFDRDTANAPWREFALPHQIEGAKILAAQSSGILGDKMGLGKTLTSLIFADMVKSRRLLVVVPADVIRNYEREIAHWTPHRQVFPFGRLPKNQRTFVLNLLSGMDEFVVTVNYEAWRRDDTMINSLIDLHFDTVILDEAHVMKTASSTAARGVTRLVMAENACPFCNSKTINVVFEQNRYGSDVRRDECIRCDWNSQSSIEYKPIDRRSIKHVLPMTGTPILNKPEDLFPMLHLIDPMQFHSLKHFRDDFLELDYYTNKYTFRPGGMESLSIKLGSKMVSRDRTSAGVVLPKQEIQVHDIDFDKENYAKQWRIMQQLSEHAQIVLEQSGDTMTAIAQIALITRQRQANVWPAGIQIKDPITGEVIFSVGSEVRESLKLDRVEDMIDDYTDERVVIFSQFKTPLRELEKRLLAKGVRVVCFDGDTPEALREEIKFDFDRKYTAPGQHRYDVVLCNYKTGGVGLNFTGATQMIILDEEWNPGKRDQAMARIDRVGQTEESTVHVLRINNTVDTWLAGLIAEKEEMIDGFTSTQSLHQAYLSALKNGEA